MSLSSFPDIVTFSVFFCFLISIIFNLCSCMLGHRVTPTATRHPHIRAPHVSSSPRDRGWRWRVPIPRRGVRGWQRTLADARERPRTRGGRHKANPVPPPDPHLETRTLRYAFGEVEKDSLYWPRQQVQTSTGAAGCGHGLP